MVRFDGAIEIELPDTWPDELRRLLDDNLELLRVYESDRTRIDRLSREDIFVRINRPPNPHAAARDELVERANALLNDKVLLGFHCNRLAEDEAAAIRADGLEPLTPALLERRICWRVEAGELTPELAEVLLADHQAAQQNRQGMIWFVHSRSILQDEGGLYRLFRSWGGEALYWAHESHPEIGAALRAIGRPCIVVAAMPIANIQSFLSMGETFITEFLDRHGVRTGRDPKLEAYVRNPVGPDFVKALIFHGQEAFEELTGCSSWREPIA